MSEKKYRLTGVDVAIRFLRPNAKYIISGMRIEKWDDPRPEPTWNEIQDTLDKLKALEDSINTIELENYPY